MPYVLEDAAAEQPKGRFVIGDAEPEKLGVVDNLVKGFRDVVEPVGMGLARGAKDVIDTGAHGLARAYDFVAGNKPTLSGLVTGQPQGEYARIKAADDAGKAEFEARYGNNPVAGVSRFGGQVMATLPVGGFLGQTIRIAGAPALGEAIATGGMRAGETTGLRNLVTRSAGGAIGGTAMVGATDPDRAASGAVVGAALPPVFRAAGAAGNVVGAAARPFFRAGQERAAGDVLNEFAANPAAARQAMQASQEIIPGSQPTAIAAAGDVGLSGLGRTMQNASPEYTNNLTARQTAQNAARTQALDDVAGNPGRIAAAQAERDRATGAMRETALEAAGNLPAAPLLRRLDSMLLDPNNAGQTAQQALRTVRTQLAGMTQDGAVNARALYELRKDINLAMEGRLQGEAGNMRFAKSQLIGVKNAVDDAIEAGSQRVNLPQIAGPGGTPRASWRDYLRTYTDMSRPINQMETLQDVLRRIQNSSTDTEGNLVLSAAKLNTILKNETPELQKTLHPEQLDLLRRLSADLNASQTANTAGKAVGSNTVQNLASDGMLRSLLGETMGRSTPAHTIGGRLLQIPYGYADRQIQGRIGQALLEPQYGAQIMDRAANSVPLSNLVRPPEIAYRAAPAIVSNPK